MSRSTVNDAVGRLLSEGRVREVATLAEGRGSRSGRPAISLDWVASGAPVAATGFGRSHVAVAVADALGRPLGQERLRTSRPDRTSNKIPSRVRSRGAAWSDVVVMNRTVGQEPWNYLNHRSII